MHMDDLIVEGSLCVGLDCVDGEAFAFDTLRLKEEDIRIRFQDTSATAFFPTNDWQIVINDTSNGGGEFFAVEDISNGRTPFKVEADAPTNSLYVEEDGDVGFGTPSAVVKLHAVDGDTPTLRLEQDASSGMDLHAWDLGGNEEEFFLRDVTNGSKLPLRILALAPDDSLFVDADGDVGMGTDQLDAKAALHIQRSDGGAQLLVDEDNASAAARDLMILDNATGNTRYRLKANGTADWVNTVVGATSEFRFDNANNGGVEFKVSATGDVTAAGMITGSSDRDRKRDVEPVEPAAVLERVSQLPIHTWRFEEDASEALHLGPMAQDFHAAFGLGQDERHIGTLDASGVALAAIQGLYERLQEKEAELDELRHELTERLAALEELAGALEPPGRSRADSPRGLD